MPSESEVRTKAASICAADGRGIRVTDLVPTGCGGYAVTISVPKQQGMSDHNWHTIVADVRDKLQLVQGIERVMIDVA